MYRYVYKYTFVCIYVYICICIHIHMYIYIYIYIHTYTHTAGISPNLVTYNVILGACNGAQNVTAAFAMFDELQAKGLRPRSQVPLMSRT